MRACNLFSDGEDFRLLQFHVYRIKYPRLGKLLLLLTIIELTTKNTTAGCNQMSHVENCSVEYASDN
jgi:hypothetical protein